MSNEKHLKNEILKIPPERFDEDFRYMIGKSFLLAGVRYQENAAVPYDVEGTKFIYKFMTFTPLRLTKGGVVFPSLVHTAHFSLN